MIRLMIAVVLVCCGIAAVSASPVKGRAIYLAKAPEASQGADGKMVGDPLKFEVEYEAGQRAVACVQGDHLPVVPVTIQVFDEQKRLVGEHRPKGDVAAVVWYPERRQKYTVLATSFGVEWNELTVILR